MILHGQKRRRLGQRVGLGRFNVRWWLRGRLIDFGRRMLRQNCSSRDCHLQFPGSQVFAASRILCLLSLKLRDLNGRLSRRDSLVRGIRCDLKGRQPVIIPGPPLAARRR